MTTPSRSKTSGSASVKRRRLEPGERNRGAVDALQTKIAVNVQHLDQDRFKDQLNDNIGELPDAWRILPARQPEWLVGGKARVGPQTPTP